jgi:hypothetical protein
VFNHWAHARRGGGPSITGTDAVPWRARAPILIPFESTRLGRLHCVGPKRRAAQINAVNTMLRWTAAGLAEAQKGFRRVKGHRDLPELTAPIRRELNPTPTEEAAAARAWGTHPLRTCHRR